MGEVLGSYVEAGDYLFLKYAASVAPSVMAGFIEVEDKRGRVQPYEVEVKEFTIDKTIQSNEEKAVEIQQDGKIVGGGIRRNADALRRGQCYAILDVQRRLGADLLVAKGYVYSTNPIGLGEFTEAAGGMGNLYWNAIANDVAPGASLSKNLATTNARRIIWGFAWYYHSSGDTATRVLRARVQDFAPARPTGMTSGIKTSPWLNPGTTSLTANQEGTIYVMGFDKGGAFVSAVDDGVINVGNTGTQASIFPLSVIEDDDAKLLLTVVDPHANDRHSAYILIEEWMSF